MLSGITNINLDSKGRIAIPAKYRASFGDDGEMRVAVTVDPTDHCLLLYPEDEWEEIIEQINSMPNMSRKVRKLQRLLIGHSQIMDMDKQGRILIPAELREFANLEKKVVLMGQSNKFELWSAEEFYDVRDDWRTEAADNLENDEALKEFKL